jgi:hypothetical protein
MGNLSSETLFHFTGRDNGYDTLISIINNGFYPRYSKEEFPICAAIPMVCFCDIPLSKIKEHMEVYGTCALGMKKEWGIKNGISPVFYVSENSNNLQKFENVRNYLQYLWYDSPVSGVIPAKIRNAKLETMTDPDLRDFLINMNKNLLDIIKDFITIEFNMKLVTEDSQITTKQRKFYDEKEWRLIPKMDYINESAYDDEVFKKKNSEMTKCALEFNFTDIRYIIIEDDSMRANIISVLKKRFNTLECDNYINSQKITILTNEQINNDF